MQERRCAAGSRLGKIGVVEIKSLSSIAGLPLREARLGEQMAVVSELL